MHKQVFITFILLASAFVHAGTIYVPAFQTYESGFYRPAERNIELLKEMKLNWKPFKIIDVKARVPGDNYRLCRGSFPIYSLGKRPYEDALASALGRELNSVGLYSESGSIPIAIELNVFDFSTVGSGKWTIEATFTIGSEEPITVTHEFPFSIGLSAAQACSDASFAQYRAVQEFLFMLYTNPRFQAFAQKDVSNATGNLSAP